MSGIFLETTRCGFCYNCPYIKFGKHILNALIRCGFECIKLFKPDKEITQTICNEELSNIESKLRI